jgi:hypothetical protein
VRCHLCNLRAGQHNSITCSAIGKDVALFFGVEIKRKRQQQQPLEVSQQRLLDATQEHSWSARGDAMLEYILSGKSSYPGPVGASYAVIVTEFFTQLLSSH